MSRLIVCFFLFTSCVSTHTALQEMRSGSSKEQVRNTAGKPYSVDRYDGMDRWTYKFSWNSQEYTRDVFFDEGRVQKVGTLTLYPNYEKKMKSAETLEEYEINASLYQKQKESAFREINSEKSNTLKFCSSLFGLSSSDQTEKCRNLMNGKRFMYPALQFCIEKIWDYNLKTSCLSEAAGKIFDRSLLYCPEGALSETPWEKSWRNDFRTFRCLKQTKYTPFPDKDKKGGVVIFNCSRKALTVSLRFPSNKQWQHSHLGDMENISLSCEKNCPEKTEHFVTLAIPESDPDRSPQEYKLSSGQIYSIYANKNEQKWSLLPETGHIICDPEQETAQKKL